MHECSFPQSLPPNAPIKAFFSHIKLYYLLSAYTLYNTPFLPSGSFYLYNLVGKTGKTQRKFKKHKWHEDIKRQYMNKKPERAKTRLLRGRNNQRCYRKEVLLWWMVKNIGQLSGIHTVDIKGPAHKAICKGCSHYNNLAILFKLAKSWKQLEWPSTDEWSNRCRSSQDITPCY